MNSAIDAPFADLDLGAEPHATGRGVTLTQSTNAQIRGEFATVLQQSRDFNDAVEDLSAAISWDLEGRSAVTAHGDAVLGRQCLARLHHRVRAELEAAPEKEAGRGLIASAALLKSLVKHGVAIALRVVTRLRSGRGHGIHATIVEEILRELYADLVGATVWGMMRKDAYDHFVAGGLGEELVQAIADGDHKLVVVGHSAGSIWASAMMLSAAKQPQFPKFSLILLAPAVRMEEFSVALDASKHLIKRFRIFSMNDTLEQADAVLGHGTGAIYPSSLLYLVSGLFEETNGKAAPDAPLLGMQRFLDRAPDWIEDAQEKAAIEKVRAFANGIANSAIYAKAAGGEGLSTDATAHGDFDNNVATLSSVHSLL